LHVRSTTIVPSTARRLGHGLAAAVAAGLVVVGRATAGGGQALRLALLDLGHGREAVVFAVDGGDEVHDEGGDEEDVDEGDDPFEDGGDVVFALVVCDAKTWSRLSVSGSRFV